MSDKRTGKKAKKAAAPKVAPSAANTAALRVTGGAPQRATARPLK